MSVSPLPTCRKLRPTCGEVFASGQTMPVQPAAAGDAERSCDLLARATCASSRPKRHDAHITSHRIHIGRITMNESSMWCLCLLIQCIGLSSLSFQDQASFNFRSTVTILSDFAVQENKMFHCFHFSPFIYH